MDPAGVLRRFLLQVPVRFEVGAGEPEASGVFFDIDPGKGICTQIQPFRMTETEMRSRQAWKTFSNP
jgi:calcineurin-like phosphoesterase